jgi:hypothetical protein
VGAESAALACRRDSNHDHFVTWTTPYGHSGQSINAHETACPRPQITGQQPFVVSQTVFDSLQFHPAPAVTDTT